MRREKAEASTIFWIEPTDEKQAVFHQMELCRGKIKSLIVVLPKEPTRAFQSPRDFHELKLLKRLWDLQIVFVIPKQSQAQWARSNHFAVTSSLESMVKKLPGKAGWAPVSTSQLEAKASTNGTSSPRRSSSLAQLPKRDEPWTDPLAAPALAPPEPSWHLPGAVAHPPELTGAALEEEGATPASSPSLGHDPASPGPVLPTGEHPWTQSRPAPRLSRSTEALLRKPAAKRPSSQPLHPSLSTPTAGRQQDRRRWPWLLLVLAIVLLGAALSSGLLVAQRGTLAGLTSPAPAPVPAATLAGHLYFLSSGQIDEMGTTGIDDVVTLTLSHLAPPAAGKSYYAWLKSDANRSVAPIMLLGRLQVSQGKGQLTYSDLQHSNLLLSMSQVLVTEEDAGVEPVVPSPDRSTWRYTGLIPQTPTPADTQNHFSYLDHIRHMLAADPALEKMGLHGGLIFWLEKNSRKVNEWATAAQDEGDGALIHRHLLRILDYLDGI